MKKSKKWWYWFALIIIIISVIIIISFRGSGKRIKVLVSTVNISSGTEITQENISDMLVLKSVNNDNLPDDYIKELSDICGRVIKTNMCANTIMQSKFLYGNDDPAHSMKKPVIVGLKANDISQFAGGIIRRGDRINISVVDSMTSESISVLNNVYVTGAYNSDGTKISDLASCAMAINVIIEKEEEQRLNKYITVGELRVSLMGVD